MSEAQFTHETNHEVQITYIYPTSFSVPTIPRFTGDQNKSGDWTIADLVSGLPSGDRSLIGHDTAVTLKKI